MNAGRLVYVTSTLVILLVLVLSGPLTGGIAFAPDDPEGFGYGTISLTPETTPEEVVISSGRFDAGLLVLSVPDTIVRIEQVTGRPLVTYKLNIPTMGYVRQSLHIIDADATDNSYALSLGETPIEPELVDESQYTGTLSIEIRDDAGTRTPYSWNVTVVVTQ
jgi:hypothetical protein